MAGKFDYHDAKPASSDVSEDIAAVLRESVGMTRAQLRKELGENRETINRNLQNMIAAQVVSSGRLSGEIYYFMRDGQ